MILLKSKNIKKINKTSFAINNKKTIKNKYLYNNLRK